MSGGKLWLKSLYSLVRKNFRKIRRVSGQKDEKIQKLINQNINGRKNEEEICEEVYKKNRDKVISQVNDLSEGTGNMSRVKFWKMKNRMCPKIQQSAPVANIDKDGNILSNKSDLQKQEVMEYKHRLRSRDKRPNYNQLRKLKENLFNIRLKLSKKRKSNPWKTEQLLRVTKAA